MDVGAIKTEVIEKLLIEKLIHISLGGGRMVEYRCGICDITPQGPNPTRMHILGVFTQRRLCCALSVHFPCTTLNH